MREVVEAALDTGIGDCIHKNDIGDDGETTDHCDYCEVKELCVALARLAALEKEGI